MVSALKQMDQVWGQDPLFGFTRDVGRHLQDSLESWHCPSVAPGVHEHIAFHTDTSLAFLIP